MGGEGEDRKPGNDEGMRVGKREGEREEGGRRKGRAVSFHYTFRVHDIALLYHV